MKRASIAALFTASTLVSLVSCRPQLRDPISASKSAGEATAVEAAWNDYFVTNLGKNYPYDLQEPCKPVFAKANPDVPFKGTVMFFHGYTACAQQFFVVRDTLTAAGYHVMIPVLPGQGRAPAPVKGETAADRAYYYEMLPSVERSGSDVYRNFVNAMNDIMRLAPGPHMVGGLSVGGALALGAVFQSPGLYQRALILAPFFTVPPDNFWRPVEAQGDTLRDRWKAFYANAKLKIAGDLRRVVITHKTDLIPEDKRELRWGDSCYYENSIGRGGICDTHMKNLAAVVQYADGLRELIEKGSNTRNSVAPATDIQIATVEYDDGSDTRATKDVFKTVRDKYKFKMALCFYRGVPHSFLSKFDHPGNEMRWLPHFYDRVGKFFNNGEFFDTDGPSQELINDPGLVSSAVSAVFPKRDGNLAADQYFELCHQ